MAFSEAIRLDPAYANAYCNRGTVYFTQGDLPRALADFNKAIELEPTLAPPSITAAWCAVRRTILRRRLPITARPSA